MAKCILLICVTAIVITAQYSEGATKEAKPMSQLQRQGNPIIDMIAAGIPFGFVYDGNDAETLLPQWAKRQETKRLDNGRSLTTASWTDKKTGLTVICETTRFEGFPAVEWLVRFRNDGVATTPIIENVQAMDLSLDTPLADGRFVVHQLNGAPSDPSDFEPKTVALAPGTKHVMGGGGGRSSNKDFPFFRVDTGTGTLIVAVGWSGQWKATLQCRRGETKGTEAVAVDPAQPANKASSKETGGSRSILHLTAGLELTRFRLNPGEGVRGPRMLVLSHQGDPDRSYVVFRRLMLKHYVARAHGAKSISQQPIAAAGGKGAVEPQPLLFCNTCFTRKGGWLNECNESNQISLIRALAPLGVQAVITDAGWFKGGWPNGAGNWEFDPQKYPRGIGPVAAAAKECGMTYGLWFEPERVVVATPIDREHAPWVLRSKVAHDRLLNFGVPEARRFFFEIVEQYLRLPGVGVYRQDFNIDPLPFWRENDEPDRQGVHEMKYIEDLYAFWDMIRAAHPDILMEECASGGRRVDLETVMRFQIHQKSDFWFDNLVDQASLYALSRYLPNGTISVPLDRLDDYSFHSAMASSLITGWIADDPHFNTARARQITDTYRSVRHLLNADWYGLTPWSRDLDHWLVSQYHRDDLAEGMILAFRRDKCGPAVTVQLKGLTPESKYEIRSTTTGQTRQATGAEMMNGLKLAIPQAPGSDLIVYRKL